MHILSPETDNCPSWISGRERMTVENISWSISTKECCRPRQGLNPRPPGLQSDGASNWATEAGTNVKCTLKCLLQYIGFNIFCANTLWGYWVIHVCNFVPAFRYICYLKQQFYFKFCLILLYNKFFLISHITLWILHDLHKIRRTDKFFFFLFLHKSMCH